jgi:hypothetical protein
MKAGEGSAYRVATLVGDETTGSLIAACPVATKRSICLSPLTVKVLPRIELPPLASGEGAIARLLLAENRGPEDLGFVSLEETQESMRWMRRVLQNRLEFPAPGAFFITKKDMLGVITARNQFEGFENYPQIASGQSGHIRRTLESANEGGHRKFAAYRQHAQNALDIASGKIPLIADPCPTGLYGWKTVGSQPPSSNFELYQQHSGQNFYALKKEFLSQHGKK